MIKKPDTTNWTIKHTYKNLNQAQSKAAQLRNEGYEAWAERRSWRESVVLVNEHVNNNLSQV